MSLLLLLDRDIYQSPEYETFKSIDFTFSIKAAVPIGSAAD
jgi:hypothetical protein